MKKNVLDAPAYAVSEAAFLLRMNPATLKTWVHGRGYHVSGGDARFQPVIELADPRFLSFNNLVEAHVLSAIRKERVRFPAIRDAVQFCREQMGTPRPLLHQDFQTDGVSLFVEHLGRLVNATSKGQLAMRDVLGIYLRRIERKNGVPVRLFPFTHNAIETDPGRIVIDPAVSFGRPMIARIGVPAESIADQFRAGDTIDEIAEDFGADRIEVEEAIRACDRRAAA